MDEVKYTKNNRSPQLYSEGNDRRTRQSRSAGAGKFRTPISSATQLPCNTPCGVPLRSATKTEAGLFPQEKDPAPT
ncbi:MAG: hypothetical protein BHV66_00525 [Alistipes putredinis]|uniref:Uncharacterized protein n=1 Tax=Alistipes putredinis TaxID=28117 RepID=A0A1Q6FCL8_9BACT|nr:MAG: hypothetical protein BHV66_00525 [Alistipes putredinis]